MEESGFLKVSLTSISFTLLSYKLIGQSYERKLPDGGTNKLSVNQYKEFKTSWLRLLNSCATENSEIGKTAKKMLDSLNGLADNLGGTAVKK